LAGGAGAGFVAIRGEAALALLLLLAGLTARAALATLAAGLPAALAALLLLA
jgi:hypothetical protein